MINQYYNLITKINKNQLINTFLRLVKIDSISLQEKKFINYITQQFKSFGLTVKFQKVNETGNIVAILKGNKKNSIFFNAHMDTVEPGKNIKPIVTDKLIKSDGNTVLGGDDKAAIAIFIEAIKLIKKYQAPVPEIYFVLTYGEEIGLEGAKHFDFSLLKPKTGFSFDADGPPGTIVLSAPTHWVYEIKIYGKSAHAGLEPEKGKNAIKIAAELINRIKTGKLDNETTANVGKIEGGRATNIVPDFVKFTGEIRSRNKIKWQKYIKKLKEEIAFIKRKHKTKIESKFQLAYKSYKFDENSAIVKKVVKACKLAKLTPKFEHSNGGSDSNIFNQNGFKTLNLGIGMSKAHTTDEYILIKDMVNGLKLMLALIMS